MSFFKKLKSDAVTFKEKQKKSKSKKDSDTDSERGSYMQFTQCSNIHFGNTYSLSNTMYISKSAQDVNKHNTPEGTCESDLPQYVQDSFSRIEESTMNHFYVVSQHIGSGWKDLGIELGFSNVELEGYSSKEEDILKLLIAWKHALTRQATVGRLIKSLWDVHEYEAAKKLSEYVQSDGQE